MEKPFGLKRNMEYIKEMLIIKFKTLIEYKTNLVMAFINNLFRIFTQSIFLFVIAINFNDFINWSFKEYLFFIIISNLIYRYFGLLFFTTILKRYLISGNLNISLIRPINSFLQYLLRFIPIQAIFPATIYLIALIIYLVYYFEYSIIINFFMLIPFLFIGGIFSILIIRYLESFAFFIKESSFLLKSYNSTSTIFQIHPAKIFDGSKIKFISLMIPNVYFGFYATQFLFGHITNIYLMVLFLSLIIFNILFGFGIFINWHYGLKKYEAFG